MSQQNHAAPRASQGPVALKNVAAFMTMTTRLIERDPHLPGIGVCHGPSGYGKSLSSIFAQNKTGAIRVEVGDSWTRRTLLQAILKEVGEEPKKRLGVADLAQLAIAALGNEPGRPLIIDEADKLVDKGFIEIVREIQEFSGVAVILIGEEKLPGKLLTVERVHNRVLDWFAAQPCDLDDARRLAQSFAPNLRIADDLLDLIRERSGGRARRIVVNVSNAVEIARNKKLSVISRDDWGDRPFHTGQPPTARPIEAYRPKAAA